MRLITNENDGHRSAIADVFTDADHILIAVAFLKVSGAEFLRRELKGRLSAGARVEIFVGSDFFLTDPEALAVLLSLARRNGRIDIFLASRDRNTFHPKIYAGFGSAGVSCLTGSANLTGGGIGQNVEASLLVTAADGSDLARDLRGMFEGFRLDRRHRRLDDLVLAAYRTAWKPAERQRRQFNEAIAELDVVPLDVDRLDELHRLYVSDPGAQADVAGRERNRLIARRVQRAIARLGGSRLGAREKQAFQDHFRDLMSGADGGRHLWPSDAIYRQGSRALLHPAAMIELFRQAIPASKLSPREGYAHLRELGLAIPGVGPNMITEILSTFAPRRFAVINGNTREALAHLGLAFPGALQLGSLHPARYEEICGLIAAVRHRIGAKDFPEADAFLNWVYWRTD